MMKPQTAAPSARRARIIVWLMAARAVMTLLANLDRRHDPLRVKPPVKTPQATRKLDTLPAELSRAETTIHK